MGEWKQCKLRDFCKTNASSYSGNDKYSFVNYLDTGNITKNIIDEIQFIDIEKEKLPSRARRKVRYNSIVYSTVRPNQLHYGIIKEQPKNFLVSTGFTVIDVDDKVADADFIYYYLTQYEVTESMQAIGEQSTSAYPSIKASDLEDLDIYLPTLEEQKKISVFLKTLDEKIELNNKINSNLEQQAQAIFKSWFVNFENLDESIVGSWELQKLGNIACFSQGTQVPIEDQLFVPTEGYTRFIRIIDVTQPSNQDIRYIKDTKKGKVTSSDIFMIRYGTPGIVARNYAGIIANNLFKITPTTEKVTSNYLYHFLKSSDVQNYITQNAVSSTMPAINFSTLRNLEIIIPDDMTMKKFSSLSEAIRVKQLELSNENLHLSSIRDTLLPKLMSGEIDLSSIDI